MVSTVFSVMFNIFDTLLMTFVFHNRTIKNVLVGMIYIVQIFILVATNFILDEMNYYATIALMMAVVYTLLLIPFFLYVT